MAFRVGEVGDELVVDTDEVAPGTPLTLVLGNREDGVQRDGKELVALEPAEGVEGLKVGAIDQQKLPVMTTT